MPPDEMSQPLISDPTALLVFFAGFVGLVFLAARSGPFTPLFRYVPPIVWVYLLPVFGTTWGITPNASPLYDWFSSHLLPCSLLLLTMTTDLKAIARLGPYAIAMVLAGTVGIVIGGPLALAVFQSHLAPESWMGLATLAGSWIGGNENMLAIKEGIRCPDSQLGPIIIVDSVVGYGWMTVMIAFSGYQDAIDRRNHAKRAILDELNERLATYQAEHSRPMSLAAFSMILGIGFVGGWLSMRAGDHVPEIGSVFSHYTWGILIVVAAGLALSFTPARRLENEGATAVSYGGLYLLVASMGAKGDLQAVAEAPLLFAVGCLWIMIHVACLAIAARLLRAPCFLFATGSMANVGGVISAPVIAAVYQPALAPVGILMGVLGNIVGTPAGLLCAQLMAWVASAYYGDAAYVDTLPGRQ